MSTLQGIVANVTASAQRPRADTSAEHEATPFDALLLGQLSAALPPDAAPPAAGPQDELAPDSTPPAEEPLSAPAAAGALPLWLPATPASEPPPVEAAQDMLATERSKPPVLLVTLSAAPVQTEPSGVGLKSDPQPAAALRDPPPDAASLIEPPALLPTATAAADGIAPLPADVAAPSAAPLAAGAPPATARAMHITTPLNHPAWSNDFNRHVIWLTGHHEQQAELHLNPPQLGPIEIRFNLQGDQASAVFVAAQAPVREAIEQSLPKLREMLADNGIMLGNATVSDQPPREQRGEAGGTRAGYPSPAPAVSIAADRDVASMPRRVRHHGMVDTYA